MSGAGINLEIERKYLIKYPDEAVLAGFIGARRYEIEQIYLPGTDTRSERIRMLGGGGRTEYYHTVKEKITNVTRREEERLISEEEFRDLRTRAGEGAERVAKVRWKIPHGNFVIEVDIYPFWRDCAIAEIELSSEDESASFPDFLTVIREVTDEPRFTNREIAKALIDGSIGNYQIE